MISTEQKQKAIHLYKKKSLTIPEISNLTNISLPALSVILRQAFEMGILKPRDVNKALHPRTPNGCGKPRYIPKGFGKGGRNKERKKFTEEEENQIAIDYYVKGLSNTEVKKKWGTHPMQIQYVRNKYSSIYGAKGKFAAKKAVMQFDKNENFIREYQSGSEASKITGVSSKAISACCNNRAKTAGGFLWRFKNTEKTNN